MNLQKMRDAQDGHEAHQVSRPWTYCYGSME